MSAACQHCSRAFYTTRGLFGQEAATFRDAHVLICEDNPRNKCFCGRVFANFSARDSHASICEMNPANRHKCPYCPQEFVTTFSMLFAADGRSLRNAHAVVCEHNPSNTCFCGRLFPNPDAKSAHAIQCEKNPANRFDCQFCRHTFVTSFGLFGTCGKAAREVHQDGCERNPRNKCFCERLFPSSAARDSHAATCDMNPANRFECKHCSALFVTRFRMMGLCASDGKALRGVHEVGCAKNPANFCFCGLLFANPVARNAHAERCTKNPSNRFGCQFCGETFLTTFGMFSSECGSIERDAHVVACRKNPANATCEHCNTTFVDASGLRRLLSTGTWFDASAQGLCACHAEVCAKNPRNQFPCQRCGCRFVTTRKWLRSRGGRVLRDRHQEACDVIPCAYQVVDAEFANWSLLDDGPRDPVALASLPVADGAACDESDESEESEREDVGACEFQVIKNTTETEGPETVSVDDIDCFQDVDSSEDDDEDNSPFDADGLEIIEPSTALALHSTGYG